MFLVIAAATFGGSFASFGEIVPLAFFFLPAGGLPFLLPYVPVPDGIIKSPN